MPATSFTVAATSRTSSAVRAVVEVMACELASCLRIDCAMVVGDRRDLLDRFDQLRHASAIRSDAAVMPCNPPRTSSVAREVRVASCLTSCATTPKPRPISPARAASMVALSASRLVWSATSSISAITCSMVRAASVSALASSFAASTACARRGRHRRGPLGVLRRRRQRRRDVPDRGRHHVDMARHALRSIAPTRRRGRRPPTRSRQGSPTPSTCGRRGLRAAARSRRCAPGSDMLSRRNSSWCRSRAGQLAACAASAICCRSSTSLKCWISACAKAPISSRRRA